MAGASDVAGLLRALQRPDGGFGPAPGTPSEPEPTSLAALALDDDDAVTWLLRHQESDGSFRTGPRALVADAATPLAALALPDGAERERALDWISGHRAPAQAQDARFPHDPTTRGWGWTSLTFGWVEPTARAVLALRVLRPSATAEIRDGLRVLADRECDGGGWNYGNREVLGKRYRPFLQTSAAALMALGGQASDLRDRSRAAIRARWAVERGGLGWSMGTAALRLSGDDAEAEQRDLLELVNDHALLHNGVALAWTLLAVTDRLERLRIHG